MARKSARRSTRRVAVRTVAREPVGAGIEPGLLEAMSLRVPARGAVEKRLTGSEIEQALLSGEHARTLETYFGEAEYAELQELAARATQRRVRGGPRVLILPGILGSMLASVGARGAVDTIWVDFFDIIRGRLAELVLPGKLNIEAIDVHQSTYLKLKLFLREQGFDADFHPFDWRLGIPGLGRQLAARVRSDPASEVLLVAHSMGGLVARAAVNLGMDKLKRLVMLGTPNFGSFAPAMVFRGVYPFLNKVAAFDLKHSAEELAGVFTTYPGLTQMLPQRGKFSGVDLYDVGQWPSSGARPRAALLAEALVAQQKLAIRADRFVMIAGMDRETTVGLRVDAGEFVFERSRAGDGTVPLELAELPGVLTYYVAEEHGSLPKNGAVLSAVADILRNGETSKLADRRESSRAAGSVEVHESDLRARFAAQTKRSAADMSAADMRAIIAEFAAPAVAAPARVEAAPAPVSAMSPTFDSLVIARRRQRRIDIRLARGSVTQVKSRAYVLGLFESVAPAGAASAIDALMDGAITEFRQRRMFTSAVGEIFVVPGGRSDVRAEFTVFAGLGHFDTFNLQVLETVAENVARSLARMSIEEFATVPIGANSGRDLEGAVEALLRGFFRGLEDVDRLQDFRSITLCEIDETRYETLKWVLYRLSSTDLCEDIEITLSEVPLPPAPVTRRGPAAALPPSIYLTVRAIRQGAAVNIESSLLTTGAKAAVLTGQVSVPNTRLSAHLDTIERDGFQHAAMKKFGTELASLVLDERIAAALAGSAGCHVVVVHDDEASRIPWETLCVGEKFPALEGGMSRRYIAANLSVAKWLEARREDETLDVLLVVNPTQDLPGAQEEGARIKELLGTRQGVRLTTIKGADGTRARLRAEFASGKYDVLHYAGHAAFDSARVSRSGIECSDGRLTGAELAELSTLPSLVFFNACESARVRRRLKEKSPLVSGSLKERIDRNVGLAEAFLRGGVANYIGTYWPVGDASAKVFSDSFYTAVLAGKTLLEALNASRKKVDEIKSVDWADYVFYGSADFAVKPYSGETGRTRGRQRSAPQSRRRGLSEVDGANTDDGSSKDGGSSSGERLQARTTN